MMYAAAALATIFAVGALSVPNAHKNHERLHQRHAEAAAQYGGAGPVTEIETMTIVDYVTATAQPAGTSSNCTESSTPTPAPPQASTECTDSTSSTPSPSSTSNSVFATVVTASNGEMVTAQAWAWGSPHGHHGYSWTYQMPDSQPSQSPPAQYNSPPPQAPNTPSPAAASSQAPANSPPASTPAAAASAASPSPSGNGTTNQWQQNIVNAHNIHRANHSVPNIQWHAGLAQAAQMVANKCSFTHDLSTGKDICGFPSYGQNFACVGGDATEDPSKDISGEWYGEEGLYETSGSYGLPNPNPAYTIVDGQKQEAETGHFTQLVWKASTYVGCALANCPNGVAGTSGMDSLFVCDYGPEGNMGGEYADNVLRPKGEAPTPDTGY